MTCHMKFCVTAAMCLALLVFCGCGNGGGKAETDVAALNAALAVREGALSDRLGGLVPGDVENVRHFVTGCVSSSEKTFAELPVDDCDAVSALATALGMFRTGCESQVADVIEAAKAGSASRLAYGKELASLKEVAADLSKNDIMVFIDGFASDLHEKESLLSIWRRQRLEKMENMETATFPAFAAAEAENFPAWEDWVDKAAAMQRIILEDIFPRARELESNMTVRAAYAMREHGHVADAIAKIRAIPADAALVATARSQSLGVFDGVVSETINAIYKWSGDENDFVALSRKRAMDCGKRAEALEIDSLAFANEHKEFLPMQNRKDAQTAAATAKAQSEKIIAEVKDFENGMIRLKEEGEKLSDMVGSARKAAEAIRKMTQIESVEEELLADGIAEIEALRLKVDNSFATKLRKDIDEKRNVAQMALQETESVLATCEGVFAAAKAKALADEKAAKWEAEKTQMRNSLAEIKETLGTAPTPGYTRPERDTEVLRANIGRLLGKMDSMAEDELRAAVDKAKADAKSIDDRTKWTPGARHPDKPHVFAATEDGKNIWNADPGYSFMESGSHNLDVVWKPGLRHPDHSHVSAGLSEGTWSPDPGYKARWTGDLDPVWTKGTRHPDKPHIHASEKELVWANDPGYSFVEPETSNLDVVWKPGAGHPDHPHVSAGQTEGTWVPDPGYKARWSGDLDPVWTPGMRHPTWPHVVAKVENGKNVWGRDPGYDWASSDGSDFSVRWVAGKSHPDHEGIKSAQQEGKWDLIPGWTWVNPGTSDLRTRWMPGSRHPNHPHIHADNEKWKWRADDGYDFNEYNSSNLSVHWEPGSWHSRYSGVIASRQEGYWEAAAGWKFVVAGPAERDASNDLRAKWMPGTWHPTQRHVYASKNENRWSCEEGYTFVNPSGSDLDVRWTPGWVTPDGQRRAKQQEGRFETKQDCSSCENGYKVRWTKCEICNGTGKFFFANCPRCDGIGKIQNKTFCQNCNGVGWKWR